MAIVLKDDQQVDFALTLQDAAGNPATVDTAPVWTSSDESVVTVSASTDGLKATVVTTGKLGTAQVVATVKGEAGDITAIGDIQVVGGAATVALVSAGTPSSRIPVAAPVESAPAAEAPTADASAGTGSTSTDASAAAAVDTTAAAQPADQAPAATTEQAAPSDSAPAQESAPAADATQAPADQQPAAPAAGTETVAS